MTSVLERAIDDLGDVRFDEPSWQRALRAVRIGWGCRIDPVVLAALATAAPRQEAVVRWTVDIVSMAIEIRLAYPKVAGDLALRIVEVALNVGAHPYWIANVIAFESGFTTAKPNPVSGAVGLIQFMPSVAAKLFGMVPQASARGKRPVYSSAQKAEASARVAAMSAVEQMDLVDRYFRAFTGRLVDQAAVYMAVFYPSALSWPIDRRFPDNVIAMNPSFETPGDYISKAMKRARLPHEVRAVVLT